jgi:hypothetical protein
MIAILARKAERMMDAGIRCQRPSFEIFDVSTVADRGVFHSKDGRLVKLAAARRSLHFGRDDGRGGRDGGS